MQLSFSVGELLLGLGEFSLSFVNLDLSFVQFRGNLFMFIFTNTIDRDQGVPKKQGLKM